MLQVSTLMGLHTNMVEFLKREAAEEEQWPRIPVQRVLMLEYTGSKGALARGVRGKSYVGYLAGCTIKLDQKA